MSKVIRVFPRRTSATPTDDLTVINRPPGFMDVADEVHVSVAFTWDIHRAEELANLWRQVAPVTIGGPGTGTRGDDFTPGMYLKPGYVITSRGCNNRCWFCDVWKRDGTIRELPITDGWNVLDDNLLACSDTHIKSVFAMLSRQRHPVEFTGGLDTALLQEWHAVAIKDLKPKQLFFAYDTPDDLEHLRRVVPMLVDIGLLRSHTCRCFVLIGYPKDTIDAARERLVATVGLGFMPFAMLWRNHDGCYNVDWRRFQRSWAHPRIVAARIKSGNMGDDINIGQSQRLYYGEALY